MVVMSSRAAAICSDDGVCAFTGAAKSKLRTSIPVTRNGRFHIVSSQNVKIDRIFAMLPQTPGFCHGNARSAPKAVPKVDGCTYLSVTTKV
jgi:hypothetical protein